MASIQDIQSLEERIYDAVSEYLDNPTGYVNAVLHVYLYEDEMEYRAEVDNASNFASDVEVYPIETLIRLNDDEGQEVDIDAVSEIANSWIFLD